MKTIRTQIEIEASPKKIWDILTDTSAYSEWHPNIWSIDGKFQHGQRLTFHMQTDAKHRDVKRNVAMGYVKSPQQMDWREGWKVPGLLQSKCTLRIEPTDNTHSQLTQEMSYSGLLLPLLSKRLEKKARQEFQTMERALKGRAENKNQQKIA